MTSSYRPPLDDSLFILSQVLDWQQFDACPGYSGLDTQLAAAVLEEGAKFARDIVAPLNAVADREGCRIENGRVLTPTGFTGAYQKLTEAGWLGLDMPEKYGGQGLPLCLQLAFAEMLNGACIAFAMLPLMQRAAATLLSEHADPVLTERIVPRLVSGEWAATICISEAQAGSDVGRIKTRAVAEDDGSYTLHGSKIFITYGDHDLTQQITHLVLARTEQAPPGTRGLSLFLVPRLDLDSGSANQVSVSRLEQKMGLKGSPTCVLDLDGARAYRIGEEMQGLNCMFTMVNLMRLEVSMQGPALGWAACQKAIDYAGEREQGGRPDAKAIPLVEHTDVRRMLFIMRCRTEAMRALVLETAFNLDLAGSTQDPELKKRARMLAEFLLPVCKAAGSQAGFEVASLAVQVLGGHGYITDNGVEQYVRDARVSMIYEGTNGIQALDLVMRKLLRDEAERYAVFVSRMRQDLEQYRSKPGCEQLALALDSGLQYLDDANCYLRERIGSCKRDVEAGASDYLLLVAAVAGAWMWLRMAAKVDVDTDFGRLKLATGRFYADYYQPEFQVLLARLRSGSTVLDSVSSEQLQS